jgi:hypothetical protein
MSIEYPQQTNDISAERKSLTHEIESGTHHPDREPNSKY